MIISNYCKIDGNLIEDINKAVRNDGGNSYSLKFKSLNEYEGTTENEYNTIIDINGSKIDVYISNLTVYSNRHSFSEKIESIDFTNTYMTEITEQYQSVFKCVIKDVKHLNFSGVTFSKTIKHLILFSNLQNLVSLDLSNAVITNLTSLCQSFMNNEKLRKINLSNIAYNSKFDNIAFMCHNCCSLEQLDLSFLKGTHINLILGAFNSCEELKAVKGLEDIDISNSKTLEMLFFNCQKIEEISIPETNIKTLNSLATAFSQTKNLKRLKIINNSDDKITNVSVKKIFLDSPKNIEIEINKPYEIAYNTPDFLDIDCVNEETHISEKMFKQQVSITEHFLAELVANIGVFTTYNESLPFGMVNRLYNKDYTLELIQSASSYRATFITKQQILNTGTFCYIYYPTFLLAIQSNGLDDMKLSILSEKITVDINESLACKLNMQTMNL